MGVSTFTREELWQNGTELLRQWKRNQHVLTDWFFVQEIKAQEQGSLIAAGKDITEPLTQAELLCRVVERMPLSIAPGSILAGSQDGAFSPSYSLINPGFRVEAFSGYCDPTACYADISPDPHLGLTQERIDRVREYWRNSAYVRELTGVYQQHETETSEVVFFMEPVTGHTIPDLRPFLQHGIRAQQERARASGTEYGNAMTAALEAVCILANRYRSLAVQMAGTCTEEEERVRLEAIVETLSRIPEEGASSLHEAVQMFALLWQVMVLEQAPNPYAFSVGNLDRILAPYYTDDSPHTRAEAVELVRQLLCFFQVGDRCWAISQNLMVGGRDTDGTDMASEMTYIVLDAFFASNDPQPALSVKVHAGTPQDLFASLGRFFFTPGHSTPSLFNDDSVFTLLKNQGVADTDLPDYSIAGCQEPLIMGKASLNTTNTWLNLAKVLELACNDGRSLLSGKQLGPSWSDLGLSGAEDAYVDLEHTFFVTLAHFLPAMEHAGNACTDCLGGHRPVPFTSAVMDSFASWRDMRDPTTSGTRYHGSGCLIHGLSVVADALHATRRMLDAGAGTAKSLQAALQENWEGSDGLRVFLQGQDKYGNNHAEVDATAARIAQKVCMQVGSLRNSTGNAYLADWSTPSTHLLYGYWVGATPDGRAARRMLGYGIDPLPEATREGLIPRMQSCQKLPFHKMTGGYASHIGLTPQDICAPGTLEAKGEALAQQVIAPLFCLAEEKAGTEAPFYVYFNIDDVCHLRKLLEDPERHAPSGIYILRIHGTFVNFLDLSPAIQKDIIERLEQNRELSV